MISCVAANMHSLDKAYLHLANCACGNYSQLNGSFNSTVLQNLSISKVFFKMHRVQCE